MSFFIKKLLPKSLLSRSLIILISPLLMIQLILGHIYFDRHTESILDLLSKNIAGEISFALEWLETNENPSKIKRYIASNLDIQIEILPVEKLERSGVLKDQWLYQHLRHALDEKLKKPYFVKMTNDTIYIQVESKYGVIECRMSRKKLFSRTIPLVLIWTSISAVVLFVVASVFMRNQIRPIKRLAKAAEKFGRGEAVENYVPEGALEVRQAGISFLMMKERITHLLNDRMQMLAGVSHDLRTPLTRLKLQMSLLEEGEEKKMLMQDLKEMQNMLEGYLDYSRGILTEKNIKTDIVTSIRKICTDFYTDKFSIKLYTPSQLFIPIKITTFNRLLTNLVLNSSMYGTQLNIEVKEVDHHLQLILDDNGPGIPEAERSNVFKPFYTLDASRSKLAGNVGLGLSIVKDGVRSHGGHILLKESPLGGLRVIIRLPVKKNIK